ncbi:hypothetical protein V8G54_014175 [Vigna mungo]|uniref:Uncharacterized protein n=1 Tax=Vigna mungo TaxID=3915 RepID=A0AAQ3NG48_VIGMU
MVGINKELRNLAAMVGVGRQQRQQPSFFQHGGTFVADVHGEADDVDVHGETDEATLSFETTGYTGVGGYLDEEKEDVQDVAPLLAILPQLDPHEDVPFLPVNGKQLYNLVIPYNPPWSVVSEICGQIFGTQEYCFL